MLPTKFKVTRRISNQQTGLQKSAKTRTNNNRLKTTIKSKLAKHHNHKRNVRARAACRITGAMLACGCHVAALVLSRRCNVVPSGPSGWHGPAVRSTCPLPRGWHDLATPSPCYVPLSRHGPAMRRTARCPDLETRRVCHATALVPPCPPMHCARPATAHVSAPAHAILSS